MDRRHFLKAALAAGLVPAAMDGSSAKEAAPIQKRALGSTGEKLSIIGLGGIVLVGLEQKAADEVVRGAIDRGVNYFDVAPSYWDGEAENKMGVGLRGRRDGVFLACKTAMRDRDGAAKELERSLKRLRTDRFDLYQLHGLASVEEVEKALAPGGAIETLAKAREEGRARFLGFSAHSVDAALLAMERFKFDTILFPFNWVCWQEGNFGPQVLAAAQKRGMGCLALKAMALGPSPKDATRDYQKCWYQPIKDPDEISLALRFTQSQPVTAAVPPGDERLFPLALEAAARFKPLSDGEQKKLLEVARNLEPLFRAA